MKSSMRTLTMSIKKILPRLSIIGLTIACAIGATTSVSAEEIRLPNVIQDDKEFYEALPITGTVQSYFGDFELDHSFLTPESTDKVYDLIDHQRASQLYLWSLPIVALERLVQNYFRTFDYEYGDFVRIESFNERRGYLTANETTNYALGVFNTEGAPAILDVPPGVIIGMVIDMWQESPTDIGIFGPNGGKGGRHIIIGPNTDLSLVPDMKDKMDDYQIHHTI